MKQAAWRTASKLHPWRLSRHGETQPAFSNVAWHQSWPCCELKVESEVSRGLFQNEFPCGAMTLNENAFEACTHINNPTEKWHSTDLIEYLTLKSQTTQDNNKRYIIQAKTYYITYIIFFKIMVLFQRGIVPRIGAE